MATLNNSSYYPTLDNMSYEETVYFLYGVDTNEKDSDTESIPLKPHMI